MADAKNRIYQLRRNDAPKKDGRNYVAHFSSFIFRLWRPPPRCFISGRHEGTQLSFLLKEKAHTKLLLQKDNKNAAYDLGPPSLLCPPPPHAPYFLSLFLPYSEPRSPITRNCETSVTPVLGCGGTFVTQKKLVAMWIQ